MTKATYFAAAMNQSVSFLRACLAHQTPAMRPVHRQLIRLALRKKGEVQS